MNTILYIFLGGGFGSLARFGVGKICSVFFRTEFPLGTFFSNTLSCLILAVSVGFLSEKIIPNSPLRFFLLTGFCGGFSTFSTFSQETIDLMRSGNLSFAILNIAMNILVCFCIIFFLSKSY